jgi:hypothetical protein
MKHWVVPHALAEIKNKTVSPPPGLLGHQEVGSPGLMPSTAYLYMGPTLFTARSFANLTTLSYSYSDSDRPVSLNEVFRGFSQYL